MESEKGWAVWSPCNKNILLHTISGSEEAAINRTSPRGGDNWSALVEMGYRLVEITISYEKPQASDEG